MAALTVLPGTHSVHAGFGEHSTNPPSASRPIRTSRLGYSGQPVPSPPLAVVPAFTHLRPSRGQIPLDDAPGTTNEVYLIDVGERRVLVPDRRSVVSTGGLAFGIDRILRGARWARAAGPPNLGKSVASASSAWLGIQCRRGCKWLQFAGRAGCDRACVASSLWRTCREPRGKGLQAHGAKRRPKQCRPLGGERDSLTCTSGKCLP